MNRIRGIAAAPGYAIGPVLQFRAADLRVERKSVADPLRELTRLKSAMDAADGQLRAVIARARNDVRADQAAIFDAQLLMLQDPELLRTIENAIQVDGTNAEFAVQDATERYARTLEGMPDPYFRARAADVRDVARRVLRILLQVESTDLTVLASPCIVVAPDLAPSDTIAMDRDNVRGLCTVEGSETSHTAILARGLGIPAVVGCGAEVLSIPDGTEVILDGVQGEILVEPKMAEREVYDQRLKARAKRLDAALAHCHEPTVTSDGTAVVVAANIGSVDGARLARSRGAEGVGLLRTEFLYMNRAALPTEDEQYSIYTQLLEEFQHLPVVLRTCDIGGDKTLPYLDLPSELNPSLGVRGVRLSLSQPGPLLKPQLRAALRAGKGHDLHIMFPMIATVDEIRAAREVLETCRQELMLDEIPMAATVEVGIMVEVPAAALMADVLAPEVDFFSIGTNDLTQYTLAADRTNPNLTSLASAFSPAVLRLIRNVIVEGHKQGRWVGVCGELAGEPLGIPILLGLGLDEFSMNPQAIPEAKQMLRGLDAGVCTSLAEKVLSMRSPEEVRSYVKQQLPWLAGS